MSERRRLMMVLQGRLPTEYQEVEWIESVNNGTTLQYITAFTNSDQLERTIKIKCKFTSGFNSVIGYMWAQRGSWFGTIDNHIAVGGGIFLSNNDATQVDNYTVTIGKNETGVNVVLTCEDGTISRQGGAWATYDFFLFCADINSPSTVDRAKMSIYSFKAYDENSNLICDFIPCYRISDNEIGFYDLVTNSFKPNEGNGKLLKGPNV